MSTASPRALAERLDVLEREARRWRLSALALALVLVAGLAVSARPGAHDRPAAVQDEVRTKRLVLVDGDDTELGVLEVDGNGNPHLLLRREVEDTTRVGLLSLSGPGLLVRDGRRGAFLGVDGRGASQLELTGDDLTQGARVSVQPDGSAGFYALDDEGRRRVGLEWLSRGHGQFTAYDEEGTLRVQSGIDPLGNASTVLFDPAGLPRLGQLVSAEGQPTLAGEDGTGRTRVQLVQGPDGSSRLEFLNEEGAVFRTLPE